MAKLPALRPREVVRFLENNGFVPIALREAILSSIIYHPASRRRAVVPKHNRDMPKGTLLSLLREAGFTREEMIAFLAD